jgi:hypothetical protein
VHAYINEAFTWLGSPAAKVSVLAVVVTPLTPSMLRHVTVTLLCHVAEALGSTDPAAYNYINAAFAFLVDVLAVIFPPLTSILPFHVAEALGSTDAAAYNYINEAFAFLGSPAAKVDVLAVVVPPLTLLLLCHVAVPAEALGSTDAAAYNYINEAFAFLGSPAAKDPAAVLDMCMKLGGANFGVMKMLSEGHARR